MDESRRTGEGHAEEVKESRRCTRDGNKASFDDDNGNEDSSNKGNRPHSFTVNRHFGTSFGRTILLIVNNLVFVEWPRQQQQQH